MYKRATYRIRSNEPLTETVYRMVVEGDTQYLTAPGQFVNIELPGRFLRRPISVCDYDGHTITLIYKVIGEGTAQMAGMTAGGELDMLTGLGNGFSTAVKTERPLLVGGGVGVPPLYNLAKRLLAEGRRVFQYGFGSLLCRGVRGARRRCDGRYGGRFARHARFRHRCACGRMYGL